MVAVLEKEIDDLELKNTDPTLPKSVYDEEGVRHEIPPLGRVSLPAPLAREFLAKHPRWVHLYEEEPIPVVQGERTVYIANVTGSRMLPDDVEEIKNVEGKDVVKIIPNPNRVKQVLEFKLQGAQRITGPDSSRKSTKDPNFTARLEPLRRYAMPENYANTILQRTARVQKPYLAGRVIRVPEPAEYEPNETWDLDDIRLYAYMTDPSHFTEKRITHEYPPLSTYRDGDGKLDKREVTAAKRRLLEDLFPSLIDDRYTKPTRAGFEKAKRDLEKVT